MCFRDLDVSSVEEPVHRGLYRSGVVFPWVRRDAGGEQDQRKPADDTSRTSHKNPPVLPHPAQTAPKFYLLQWGIKPTVSHWCNPADLHILTLAHRGPHSARCVALVARRADVYRVQSSSLRTGVKEIVTLLGKSPRSISNVMRASNTRGITWSFWRSNLVWKTACPRIFELTNRVNHDAVCTSAFEFPLRYNRAADIRPERSRPHGANDPHAGRCR
jgi:hypothetical protein